MRGAGSSEANLVAPKPTLLPWCPLISPHCSVEMDAGAGSNEDDITMKLMQVVEVNNILKEVRGLREFRGG
jgi:hypothetical protein